jgi:enolase
MKIIHPIDRDFPIRELKKKDKFFVGEKNDENAWKTSLNEKEILEILGKFEKVDLGLDVAASSIYRRKKYKYENPKLERTPEEQKEYLKNLIKNFRIFYLEDGFEEDDFKNFSELRKENKDLLVVGDDLTTTNMKRLRKAVEEKSINAIIVKPNQCGSLIEVKEVCEFANKNKIKIVFSHRSGETNESILADLAFGFQADFFKCGIDGEERESKIKRLIEIEEAIK